MARTEARIFTSIWSDDEFFALNSDAKLSYLMLLSQPKLSRCGVLDVTLRSWSELLGVPKSSMIRAVSSLIAARFVVVDNDTEELWIRTLAKNDGGLGQPNMVVSMTFDFEGIRSRVIRRQFIESLGAGFLEGLEQHFQKAWAQDLPQRLRQGFVKGFQEVFPEHLPQVLAQPLRVRGRASPISLNPKPLNGSGEPSRTDPELTQAKSALAALKRSKDSDPDEITTAEKRVAELTGVAP
jgi:hypothetical protein